ELASAGNADVAKPGHRQVFLDGAQCEPLLVEPADYARDVARLVGVLQRLAEARPRSWIVPALLLLRRDALELGDVPAPLAGLGEHLRHLVGAEDERNDRRHRADHLERRVEQSRDRLHDLPGPSPRTTATS